MEEQFSWPLVGHPIIKAQRSGWVIQASTGAVFDELQVVEIIQSLPEVARRFGELLAELPDNVEHYERTGQFQLHVHEGVSGITAHGVAIDLDAVPELIEALERAVARGDALVGSVRRGAVATVTPKAAAPWPAPSLPTMRKPLRQVVWAPI